MAYDLENRSSPDSKYFTLYDPGAYQYNNSIKCKPNKAPFNSTKPRDTQAVTKLWTHALYNASKPRKIPNCMVMQSKIPRFSYEILSKEDLGEYLCKRDVQNLCECPIYEQEEEIINCHAKVPRRIFKGIVPSLFDNGLLPSQIDRRCKVLANESVKRIKNNICNECPPFYDTNVNEFTKFYQGFKWSKRTSRRTTKASEASPGPADYNIKSKKTRIDFEICAEKLRSYKRKTSKQLRFIDMVQQRNILENLPGPSSYSVKFSKFMKLQHLGPKALRFSYNKIDEAPGPADYLLRRDFDVTETPESVCHARLPERPCFGVQDTRFKPLKELGPSPASYSPVYWPCNFLKCPTVPFGNSAIRFKEVALSESEINGVDVRDIENEKNKKPCILPTWQFKSKSIRYMRLKKKFNEPSPADFPQPKIKIARSQQSQYVAPFFTSQGRFQPWFDWMPVFGKVKTPGPCSYKLGKPKYTSAVSHGPLYRAARFPFHTSNTPSPNEYNIGGGIETILATHNRRLKNNIEKKNTFIWEAPTEPEQQSFENQITVLLEKSIALLEVGDGSESGVTPNSKKHDGGLDEQGKKNKMLRSVLYGQKIVDYY